MGGIRGSAWISKQPFDQSPQPHKVNQQGGHNNLNNLSYKKKVERFRIAQGEF